MISLRYIKNGDIYGICNTSCWNFSGHYRTFSCFLRLYHESKNKNETIVEISRNLDDPDKLERLLGIFDERKKEPIDYRRGGLITIFVGMGIYFLGLLSLVSFFEGVGLLVGFIGIGTMAAGYIYPNTSEEITKAVENFEEK